MLGLAALAGTVALAAGAVRPPPEAAPRGQRFPTATAAVVAALDEARLAGGVVAFGELHQTTATAGIESALRRFTHAIWPDIAGRFSQLVVETWMTTGRCGEAERAVTADVEKTTERPAHTESEIETLLRDAHDRGVRPHILSIACADYEAMYGGGAGVDYDRTLRVTAGALETAIGRALRVAATGSAQARLVGVYGGALHNDLYPDPELRAYSFAPAVLRATLGQYVEIDLVVPAYAAGSPAVRAQSWWRVYEKTRRRGAAVLIRRSSRSFVIVFP